MKYIKSFNENIEKSKPITSDDKKETTIRKSRSQQKCKCSFRSRAYSKDGYQYCGRCNKMI